MVYFLPFHPWLALGLRVFGILIPDITLNYIVHPLLHFDATLASYPLSNRSNVNLRYRNIKDSLKAPRLGSFALQHLRI
jgi:hypothetical protein